MKLNYVVNKTDTQHIRKTGLLAPWINSDKNLSSCLGSNKLVSLGWYWTKSLSRRSQYKDYKGKVTSGTKSVGNVKIISRTGVEEGNNDPFQTLWLQTNQNLIKPKLG